MVVFLHGFCENKDLWRAFEARLSAQFQTIALDLPGSGESGANTRYQSVETMAEEVNRTLEAERIGECVVVGHSMGGYVALALADLHPQRLRGLGLFHSTAYADHGEKKNTRNQTIDFIQKEGLDPFLETFVPPLFYEGRRAAMADRMAAYRALTRQTPVATAVATTLAMRDRPDRRHVLERADFPVMFIAGRDDTALPLEANRDQFWLPKNCTVHVLAETGHLGMYEREPETLAMVEGFARRVLG